MGAHPRKLISGTGKTVGTHANGSARGTAAVPSPGGASRSCQQPVRRTAQRNHFDLLRMDCLRRETGLFLKADVEYEPIDLLIYTGIAVATGVIAGLGAWAFRRLISLFHNWLFLWKYSWEYNANKHTALIHPLGVIIIAPIIGSQIVAFLVKNFAPEARGHGVPEVLSAIHGPDEGYIRWQVAVIKIIASGISIGSGASIGREGPIVQIGCVFGSVVCDLLRVSPQMRCVIVGAGGGAGIAATFNAPVGGCLFATELLLVAVNPTNVYITY